MDARTRPRPGELLGGRPAGLFTAHKQCQRLDCANPRCGPEHLARYRHELARMLHCERPDRLYGHVFARSRARAVGAAERRADASGWHLWYRDVEVVVADRPFPVPAAGVRDQDWSPLTAGQLVDLADTELRRRSACP